MKTLKITLLLVALTLLVQATFAQVLITDDPATYPDANTNAVLDLKSKFKPLILPVIPSTNFGSIVPEVGMICLTAGFNSSYPDYHNLEFYFETDDNSEKWGKIITSWDGLSALEDVKFSSSTKSYYIGEDAGPTTGDAVGNLVIGTRAGMNMATPGVRNTVIGYESADALTSGNHNTFVGNNAGPGIGAGAEEYSTAIGVDAQSSGNYATALGADATTSGTESIAIGRLATTGQTQAISIGSYTNASGKYAVALGHLSVAESEASVAIGYNAKVPNSTSNSATAVGSNSRASNANSTALGANANVNHSNSTAIGYNAVTNSDNQIMLGANEKIFIPGLITNSNTADAGDLAVYIDPTTHQLTQGPALNPPNKGLEESEIIRSLQQENKELRQRLEKLEAIVEELAKQ